MDEIIKSQAVLVLRRIVEFLEFELSEVGGIHFRRQLVVPRFLAIGQALLFDENDHGSSQDNVEFPPDVPQVKNNLSGDQMLVRDFLVKRGDVVVAHLLLQILEKLELGKC